MVILSLNIHDDMLYENPHASQATLTNYFDRVSIRFFAILILAATSNCPLFDWFNPTSSNPKWTEYIVHSFFHCDPFPDLMLKSMSKIPTSSLISRLDPCRPRLMRKQEERRKRGSNWWLKRCKKNSRTITIMVYGDNNMSQLWQRWQRKCVTVSHGISRRWRQRHYKNEWVWIWSAIGFKFLVT